MIYCEAINWIWGREGGGVRKECLMVQYCGCSLWHYGSTIEEWCVLLIGKGPRVKRA